MVEQEKKRILLVDDDVAHRTMLKVNLSFLYHVFEAEDGVEGIELIKENDYDLVLCDIKMPKMDGVDVLQYSKKIKPELPFLMISGHGDLETAVNTMRLGAFDYISKPPDLNRLLNVKYTNLISSCFIVLTSLMAFSLAIKFITC